MTPCVSSSTLGQQHVYSMLKLVQFRMIEVRFRLTFWWWKRFNKTEITLYITSYVYETVELLRIQSLLDSWSSISVFQFQPPAAEQVISERYAQLFRTSWSIITCQCYQLSCDPTCPVRNVERMTAESDTDDIYTHDKDKETRWLIIFRHSV